MCTSVEISQNFFIHIFSQRYKLTDKFYAFKIYIFLPPMFYDAVPSFAIWHTPEIQGKVSNINDFGTIFNSLSDSDASAEYKCLMSDIIFIITLHLYRILALIKMLNVLKRWFIYYWHIGCVNKDAISWWLSVTQGSIDVGICVIYL